MSKTTLDYDRSSAQVRGSRSLWTKGLVAALLVGPVISRYRGKLIYQN